jgi:hypothetical protein
MNVITFTLTYAWSIGLATGAGLSFLVRITDQGYRHWERRYDPSGRVYMLVRPLSKSETGEATAREETRKDMSDSVHGTGQKQEKQMDDSQIKYMVHRFLGWKLPQNFNPDAGISYAPLSYADKCPPTGTNLLDATQTEAMIRYLVEGLPPPGKPEFAIDKLASADEWSR